MVPEPTAPNVMPFSSFPGKTSYPAYSTLTNLKVPELSAGVAPPIKAFVAPSTNFSQSAVPLKSLEHLLIGALPRITIPPQSPVAVSGLAREPSKAEECVKTIGFADVPLASILEPRFTIK